MSTQAKLTIGMSATLLAVVLAAASTCGVRAAEPVVSRSAVHAAAAAEAIGARGAVHAAGAVDSVDSVDPVATVADVTPVDPRSDIRSWR